MKNQKGITLVALIITIIVMLILVAVTVSILVDSDILKTAEDAGNRYKEEVTMEQTLHENVKVTTTDDREVTLKEYIQELQTKASH